MQEIMRRNMMTSFYNIYFVLYLIHCSDPTVSRRVSAATVGVNSLLLLLLQTAVELHEGHTETCSDKQTVSERRRGRSGRRRRSSRSDNILTSRDMYKRQTKPGGAGPSVPDMSTIITVLTQSPCRPSVL